MAPVSYDEVLEYGRQASQDECTRLALIFREYSQVSPAFRSCWDQFNKLDKAEKKLALDVMENGLRTLIKHGVI